MSAHRQEVIASLRADRTLARVTDLAVQVHSIDPPHPWILRSIELVAQEVAPAFGWRPAPDQHPAVPGGACRMSDPDIIDTLAGLAPDSRLAQIRDRRPVTREHAQASYRALFEPAEPGTVALQERFAVASFVAGLHAQDDLAAFYTAGLLRTAPAEAFVVALSAEADRGRTGGPYGAYPNGPLTVEDVAGPIYQVAGNKPFRAWRPAIGRIRARAYAGLPPARCQPCCAPGATRCRLVENRYRHAVTTGGILAFQIRAIAGLRALAVADA